MKRLSYIYFYFTIFLFIGTTFSLVVGWFPMIEMKWLWIMIQLVLTVVLFKNIFRRKHILFLFVYSSVLLFNLLIGDAYFDSQKVLLEVLSLLSVTIAVTIYAKAPFQKYRIKFLTLFIVVIFVTFIGTSLVYSMEPEILRIIQYAANGGDTTLRYMYAKLGVETYAFGHALPILIPPIVYSFKNKIISINIKLLLLLLLFFIVALVVMSTATTAVLLSGFLIVVSWFWNDKSKIKNIRNFIILFIVVLFLLITKDLIIDILFYLLENNESATYAGKIKDFIMFAETGEADGQISGRGNLYQESFNVFINNFILGSNDNSNIGGHSVFIDRMAMLGLIGFIPFLIFQFSFYKSVENKLVNELKPYFWFSVLFFIIMGFVKAIWSYDYLIMSLFIMPCAFIYLNDIEKNDGKRS